MFVDSIGHSMASNKHLVLGLIDLASFYLIWGLTVALLIPSLFVYHGQHGTLLLLVYIDDMILTGSTSKVGSVVP